MVAVFKSRDVQSRVK